MNVYNLSLIYISIGIISKNCLKYYFKSEIVVERLIKLY